MSTIAFNSFGSDCTGLSRRHFMRVGGLGLGGLGLAGLTGESLVAAEPYLRNRTVVLLFLSGGPSQFETFDPKPEASSEIRTVGGAIRTSLPGVAFGATFPRLAALADRLAIVRSFVSGIGDHPGAARFLQLGNVLGGGVGAVVSRLRGAINPRNHLPNYLQLLDRSPDSQIAYYRGIMVTGNAPGPIGQPFAPFDPDGDDQLKGDMTLNLPAGRFADRRALLDRLDRLHRTLDSDGTMAGLDAQRRYAFDAILRGARDAFDLDRESPRTIKRYDTSEFPIANYAQEKGREIHSSPLGKQLLLARRMVEQGCGFVMIGNASWDMHGGMLEQPIRTGIPDMGGALDKALSAFIEDIEQRGLRDRLLLVVTGEMGRTPKINKDGGRDHWGKLTPLLLYGGGVKRGVVIGASDRNGGEPDLNACGRENLLATILHSAFDIGKLRVARNVPTPLLRQIDNVAPISGALES